MVERTRGYPGIALHVAGPGDSESIYLRPHRAGLYPDAVQYTPVFNSTASWQLYSGPGFTAPAEFPTGEWFRLRLEVSGTQARLFIGEASHPALVIHDLKHGGRRGGLGLTGAAPPGSYFSNFRYDPDAELTFDDPPAIDPAPGVLRDWELSQSIPMMRIDMERTPDEQGLDEITWLPVVADPTGLVDIARYSARTSQAGDCAFARTTIESAEGRTLAMRLGYSDAVSVFLNGRLLFLGNSAYQSRDPSFLGILGPHDTIYLPLRQGANELILAVAEGFGGWGFLAQDANAIIQHATITERWDTTRRLAMPESVVFDAKRDRFYVSNFFNEGQEFIAKVTLDGDIEELHWITGLSRPTGLCLHGDRLWSVDRTGVSEIDIDAGAIVNHYPTADMMAFANDIAFDNEGYGYITDSSGSAIYRLADGAFEVWLEGPEVPNPNGICIVDGTLLVGDALDGALQAIDLQRKEVRTLMTLQPRLTIDGVQPDGRGGYIISEFSGRVFRISPNGARRELLLDRTVPQRFCADICYVAERGLLVIPSLYDNSLTAYRVSDD